MKNAMKKLLLMSGALAAALVAYSQEQSGEPKQSQETLQVAAPLKDARQAQSVEGKAVEPQKFAWKSEEAKKRLATHSGAAPEASAESLQAHVQTASGGVKEGPSTTRLLIAFIIMAVLLLGLYLYLKKFGKTISGQGHADFKILGKLKIDSKNGLAVVQFHEDELLLGVNASGGLTLLANHKQIEAVQDEVAAGKVDENDSEGSGESGISDSFEKISAVDLKILGEKLK